MKAQLIPKHVSITATPQEHQALVRMAITYCREYHTDEVDEHVRDALIKASDDHLEDQEGEPDGGVPAQV